MTARDIQDYSRLAEVVSVQVQVLKTELEAVRAILEEMRDLTPGKKTRTVQDIARDTGFTPRYILAHPWLMPGFGKTDFPGKKRKWTAQNYTQWYSIAAEIRELQWRKLR